MALGRSGDRLDNLFLAAVALATAQAGGVGAPVSSPPDASAIVLRDARFEGARAIPSSDLAPAWNAYVGKSVTLDDLKAIARRAEAIYAERGYPFVAVTVPPQAVADGLVRFQVTEGRLTDLTVLGDDAAARRQATRIFQPLLGVQPLSAAAVERAYASARDTPGLAVAGALRQGSAPGGMDLVVETQRHPWRVYAGANNLNADPVGPWSLSLGADYYGASAYGDQASIQAAASPDFDKQYSLRVQYKRKLNAYGTEAGLTLIGAKANPAGAVSALNLATDVAAGRFELSQNLVDDGMVAIDLSAALEVNDQETKIFGSERLSHDALRVASFGGVVTVKGERASGSAALEVRQGLDWAGASQAGDPDLSRASADPQAVLFRWRVDGQLKLLGQVGTVRLEGQDTGASLATPEQYVVGSQSIGRGYEPGAAFADTARAVSLELGHPGLKLIKGVRAEPFVFLDAVSLSNPKADLDRLFAHRDLTSFGAGVRFDAPGALRLELLYAAPQDAPLGLGEAKPGPSVLFNVTAGLQGVLPALRHLTSGVAR